MGSAWNTAVTSKYDAKYGTGWLVTVRWNPNDKRANQTGCMDNWNENRNCPLTAPHPGGVQACFVDGSVQFISNTINNTTLLRLAARNDGQVTQFP
jgi:prepilin-type processing-associated H-X9-DG protein